ncbi:Phage capsid and scaffold [Olavius algarvensis spirochete endosymbiont]|uniref:hypothetical protein n=1 Tax=Olavius algarvensis spirochete endosymbiont TaxID=260710 RepID=UPI000F0F645E|nr:hypothetical protein [Olavius algarvensis spirochete endosymbiont]VDA99368.1 Phage capsid and scaffold [Olavius algarvensis spirochete endosymbiont]
MNKRNFVFNYVPLKRDFDELQNDMEGGIKDVAKTVAGMGILSGLSVSISSSVATISPGVAYDGQGNRIALDNALTVDMGSINRPSAGKYKWVTLALRYQVANEGQVIDGNNVSWPARLLDSCSALLLEGSDGTAVTALKPPFLNWQVPLLDIRVDPSSAWENLVTETNRRPILIPIATASAQLEAHKNERITSSHAVHGIRQGAGHGFDADTVDGRHLSEILNMVYPVGSSYIQFPDCQTPAAIGLPGTWEAQFETEGIFFRTPGGRASAFESGIQEDAMQRITGIMARNVQHQSSGDGSSGVFRYRYVCGGNSSGGNSSGRYTFDSAWSRSPATAKTDDVETRPRNRTFRIWKRTA